MKVKDAIKQLKKLDPEAVILVTSSNFELNGAEVPLSYLHSYKTGTKQMRTFRDAFDGETYQKEVWSIINGKLSVVTLS